MQSDTIIRYVHITTQEYFQRIRTESEIAENSIFPTTPVKVEYVRRIQNLQSNHLRTPHTTAQVIVGEVRHTRPRTTNTVQLRNKCTRQH